MPLTNVAKIIASRITGQQIEPDKAAAFDAVTAKRAEREALNTKTTQQLAELERLEADRGRTAAEAERSGDPAKYNTIVAEIERKTAEHKRSQDALRQVAIEVQEAERALALVHLDAHIRVVERNGNARLKTVEAIIQHYTELAKLLPKLFEQSTKLSASFPDIAPDGCLLGAGELTRAISDELYRLLPVLPTTKGEPLPGARQTLLGPRADEMTPLTKRIEDANARLIKTIEDRAAGKLLNGSVT